MSSLFTVDLCAAQLSTFLWSIWRAVYIFIDIVSFELATISRLTRSVRLPLHCTVCWTLITDSIEAFDYLYFTAINFLSNTCLALPGAVSRLFLCFSCTPDTRLKQEQTWHYTIDFLCRILDITLYGNIFTLAPTSAVYLRCLNQTVHYPAESRKKP